MSLFISTTYEPDCLPGSYMRDAIPRRPQLGKCDYGHHAAAGNLLLVEGFETIVGRSVGHPNKNILLA